MSAAVRATEQLRVVRLAAAAGAALAAWRLEPGLEACAHPEGGWWVRLRSDRARAERVLGALPADERYVCASDGTLRWPEGEVPRGSAPLQGWRPVAEICPVAARVLPSPKEDVVDRAALRLTRGGSPGESAALLVALAAWCTYASEAPQIRLSRWSYAASRAEGLALVLGQPLPTLAGEHFVEPAPRVLVPAGFGWTPPIDASALRESLGAGRSDYLWWREREGVAVLPEALFLPASRSGARRLQRNDP